MRLFIAEKPSVAKAIAGELGVTGKGRGYIECGADMVTWCIGHMLELVEPDEYTAADAPRNASGKKIWRVEDLPIIPQQWVMKPKDEYADQLAAIGQLVGKADVIVHAGDPDAEGQALVDNVLRHFDCAAPVIRYWVNATDTVSIQRGLASLKDNAEYAGHGKSATARARGDWLIGMNVSRAYTLAAQRGGSRALVTAGRVQSPTLSLVVTRDREIEAFKPVPYFKVEAAFAHKSGAFVAEWIMTDDQVGTDSEGRLVDASVADVVVKAVAGQSSKVSEFSQTPGKRNQPLTYSLSDITLAAAGKWGYSADDVLTTCQQLYDPGLSLTTYPRTDSGYLPETQFADAPEVMAAIRSVYPEMADLIDGADLSIRSDTWNTAKAPVHHGIIPTMHKGSMAGLTDMQRNIYDLIVRSYIAQFYPRHEYKTTNITVELAERKFVAQGREITRPGWYVVYGDVDDDAQQILPAVKKGDAVACAGAKRIDSKTKAPPRFNEGTLRKAMENIHKYVADPEQKKLLRDGEGIGTAATQASTITELKERKYLEVKGKAIVSTPLGRGVHDALPEIVRSPVLTALFERMLKSIQGGNSSIDEFVNKQADLVRGLVNTANSGAIKVAGAPAAAAVSSAFKCGVCGKGLSRRAGKQPGKFFWSCSGYPACNQTYPDVKGRPNYNVAQRKEK